jgi:hypothetical protein
MGASRHAYRPRAIQIAFHSPARRLILRFDALWPLAPISSRSLDSLVEPAYEKTSREARWKIMGTGCAPISFHGRHSRRFRWRKARALPGIIRRAHNGSSGMTALVQRDNSIARAITTVSASSQATEKVIQSVTRIIFVKTVVRYRGVPPDINLFSRLPPLNPGSDHP